MRTFVLFAEEGSIQRVAERLPLTQPAVTRQIQRLEQVLGFDLLDRRLKPPGLSPQGVEALARCRKVLAAYDDLSRLAAPREPEGVLRLGIAHGMAGAALAPIIRDLRQRFPGVVLRLTTGWSQPLAAQLARGALDAALLLSAEIVGDGMLVIGRDPLAIIGPAERPVAPMDPLAAPWILSPEPCDARRQLAAALARRGQGLQVAAEVQDADLQLALVREGLGLSLLPRRLLGGAAKVGITALSPKDLDLALDVQLLRSPHLQRLEPVVDVFSAAICTQLGLAAPVGDE